jgi:hypothetical protein
MGATWHQNEFIEEHAARQLAPTLAVKLYVYFVLPCLAVSIYIGGIIAQQVVLTGAGIGLLVVSWALASIVSNAPLPRRQSLHRSSEDVSTGDRFDPRYDSIFKDVISPVKMRDGGIHELKLPLGKVVRVRIPPDSKFGTHAILKGMGLPKPDGTHGALWLKLAAHPDAKHFGAHAASSAVTDA